MHRIETPPSWAMRLKERSRSRRTRGRITRWIALPTQKMRIEQLSAAASANRTGSVDQSSNDNLFAGPSRVAG